MTYVRDNIKKPTSSGEVVIPQLSATFGGSGNWGYSTIQYDAKGKTKATGTNVYVGSGTLGAASIVGIKDGKRTSLWSVSSAGTRVATVDISAYDTVVFQIAILGRKASADNYSTWSDIQVT